LLKSWRVDRSTDDTLVVHGNGARAYIYMETESAADGSQHRLLLDYSDVNLAKALVECLADDVALTVNNDFGTVLPGDRFVARCKSDKDWDWRRANETRR
jgi:hypothetical protein